MSRRVLVRAMAAIASSVLALVGFVVPAAAVGQLGDDAVGVPSDAATTSEAADVVPTTTSVTAVVSSYDSVTITAEVDPPEAEGTLALYEGDEIVDGPYVPSNGEATFRASIKYGDERSFEVRFTPTDATAYSESVSQSVSVAPQSEPEETTLMLGSGVVAYNSVELNVAVSPEEASGSVQFTRDGADLGDPVRLAGGQATMTAENLRPLTQYSFGARYLPDGSDYVGSTAATITVTTPSACITFTDIPSTFVFRDAVDWMGCSAISRGWANGDGTATYRPYEATNRDVMAALLFRFAAMSRPSVNDYVAPPTSLFSDVATDHVFYREISWMASTGISRGWDNGDGTWRYEPYTPVLRDVMSVFLFRMAQYLGRTDALNYVAPSTSAFVDVPASHVFYREISWAFDTGISTGWIDGCTASYRPYERTLRDVMAAFLHRLEHGGTRVEIPPCPEPTPDPEPASPPPMPADKNCSDFATWEEAQAFHDYYYQWYGDFARLDGDNDGVACEALKG